jgi:hypothetical protein
VEAAPTPRDATMPATGESNAPTQSPVKGSIAMAECEDSVTIAKGYDAFDQTYVLFGPNVQYPNGSAWLFQGTSVELELSMVPSFLLSNSLVWAGAWTMLGFHVKDGDTGRRQGLGLEFGYRFVAVDIGYVYDGALPSKHGVRFRAGPAFTMELFTSASYRRGCCPTISDLACECDRTAWGLSLFPYWAVEHFPTAGKEEATDGMFGFSLKLAAGL